MGMPHHDPTWPLVEGAITRHWQQTVLDATRDEHLAWLHAIRPLLPDAGDLGDEERLGESVACQIGWSRLPKAWSAEESRTGQGMDCLAVCMLLSCFDSWSIRAGRRKVWLLCMEG